MSRAAPPLAGQTLAPGLRGYRRLSGITGRLLPAGSGHARREGELPCLFCCKECREIVDEHCLFFGQQHPGRRARGAIGWERDRALLHPLHGVHPEGHAVRTHPSDDEDVGGERRSIREPEKSPEREDRNGPAVQVHGPRSPPVRAGIRAEFHHTDDLPGLGKRERTGHPRDGKEQKMCHGGSSDARRLVWSG